ncbi:MAG: glycosyltransferase [Desulfovibrionaceae bacterium]|nr:glycosyltransferase [Desulfovibrionaceae bacterium]
MSISIPVFCYHNVSDAGGHTLAMFREHLDVILDAGYRTITARELLAVARGRMRPPKRSVVLTFDDGHVSNWINAVPELAGRGMTGTFFTLADFTAPGPVRGPDTAPAMLSMPDSLRAAFKGDFSQFLTEDEIRAMLAMGMEVFSHGCRHQGAFISLRHPRGLDKAHWASWAIYPYDVPDWPHYRVGSAYAYDGYWPRHDPGAFPRMVRRSEAARRAFCREDFGRAMERIRALNGYDEQIFCWPWGQFDPVCEEELKKAGFTAAFTLERRANGPGTNPFRLNRIGVGGKKDGKWIRSRLRMYGNRLSANLFVKLHHKRPEVGSVLYATDSDKVSGGSRQMVNNIRAMLDLGIRVHALIKPTTPINDALDGLDVDVIHFDRFREYREAGKFLKQVVEEKSIDVVHTFHNRAYKAGVLARLMGAKCRLFINRGVISRPNAIFFLWTRLADGVIANSSQCAEVMRGHHVKESLLNVVYNAYAGRDFGEPKPRRKRGCRFIYAGTSVDIKGFDVFLDAAARLCESGCRDVEFVAVGVPEDRLERFADHLTPAVRERLRIAGVIPHDRVLEEFDFADVYVMTSRMESLPNTLLEGFDLGLPAVCTSVGGVPEVVRDGVNGYLCPSEDADCLAARMGLLAGDPARRFAMGRNGRNVVRRLLTPEAKGFNLMRVYMGERVFEPLAVEDVAEPVPEEIDHGRDES